MVHATCPVRLKITSASQNFPLFFFSMGATHLSRNVFILPSAKYPVKQLPSA
jgi:hypothetical protein